METTSMQNLFLGVLLIVIVLSWTNMSHENKVLFMGQGTKDFNPSPLRNNIEKDFDDKTMKYGSKCLDFEESFDNLVASSGSVYITMSSKNAGTTFHSFVKNCGGIYDTKDGHRDTSVLHTLSVEERSNVFTENYHIPKILTSHVVQDTPLIRLFEQTPRDSLIIYSHREETSRIISAARHIITEICAGRREDFPATEYEVHKTKNECVFNEAAITDLILQPHRQELEGGAFNVMTCKFYEAIEDNFPRMVFMNYKQVDQVLKVLSKHHCPENMSRSFHKNSANSAIKKDIDILVKLRKDGELVPLEDWLEVKRDKIEWTFDYKAFDQCKAKTRKMEDDLFACKDEIIQVTGDTSY